MSNGFDMVQEAFELQKLSTNSTLLEYGLQTGLIEKTAGGQMIMELLNIKLMSGSQVIRNCLFEVLLRLGVFVSTTSLVKVAIDSDSENPDIEDGLRAAYVLSIFFHQILNFDETSIRTINRILMSIGIILFSLTTNDSVRCEDMKRFQHKIRNRLAVDYYLWCLLFAMDLVLTCSSPLHINLELEYGIEVNVSHVLLSLYCAMHLSGSMRIIGHGRLAPLIMGTPLLFLDAGDDVTLAKGLCLFCYYCCFWCSDWRELVDWNHSMLCEGGICKILSTEQGSLGQVLRKAKLKFDDWRLEEGLDDDGWFILLDPPSSRTQANHLGRQQAAMDDEDDDEVSGADDDDDDNHNQDAGEARDSDNHRQQQQQQQVDYTDRVIYLQSRNPLLTSLAAIMLIVWK